MSVVEVGVRDRERVRMSHAVKGFAEVGAYHYSHPPPSRHQLASGTGSRNIPAFYDSLVGTV